MNRLKNDLNTIEYYKLLEEVRPLKYYEYKSIYNTIGSLIYTGSNRVTGYLYKTVLTSRIFKDKPLSRIGRILDNIKFYMVHNKKFVL